jgi:transposase
MATKRKARRSGNRPVDRLGKPSGIIQPRVEAVGPQHFGIAAVDCGKARSKWMLCDFYGRVLIPPTIVEHGRAQLQLATVQLREACERYDLKDHLVAVEITGAYHRPIQRAFRRAGSETRLVHPFASHHYRLPASADIKTDDTDLEAIFRAAVNGFGLLQAPVDERYQRLQIVIRHRRDLVEKRAKLQCQIREALERCLPGYGALFPGDELWEGSVGLCVPRRAHSAAEIRAAGVSRITGWLREEKLRFWTRTVERIVAWSGNAADADPWAASYDSIWRNLHEDWLQKTVRITALEREMAEILVKTPYLLLLSHPGINVVSAADLAGELGPIEHYAHARAITGRAGIFPARYQSDEVDRPDRPLARHRNAKIRAACLRIADNLIKCNVHFRCKFELWKQHGVDYRDIRCRVANRAMRSVFQLVSGRRLYHHPSRLDRDYVLDKLLEFHQQHQTTPQDILRDLNEAADQIPRHEQAAEAAPLVARYQKCRKSRLSGSQQLSTLLLAVLARYGITGLESKGEAQGPTAAESDASTC